MLFKLLETFFRHKLLILLPPVVIVAIVTPITLLTARPSYQSSAAIWVERATYLNTVDDSSRYTMPAETQGTRLTQMFNSRSFVMDVAGRTALAPLVGSLEGESTINRLMLEGLAIAPKGNNLLTMQFRSPSPELSFQVLSATIDRYKERALADVASQSEQAIVFYEARVRDAEEQLAKSSETVRRYVAGNPRLRPQEGSRGGTSAPSIADIPLVVLDPQLAEMQSRLELEKGEVERARRSLEQVRLQTSAGVEAQELGFRVVDPPQVPVEAIRETRKKLMIPAAGLLVGIGLSAVLLVILVASDRSVRSKSELPPTIRVIGAIPELRGKVLPQRAGRDRARLTVGFVAGSALPAPKGGS